MKKNNTLYLFLGLLVLLPTMLIPAEWGWAEQRDDRFLLLYSNDVRGELEPCG